MTDSSAAQRQIKDALRHQDNSWGSFMQKWKIPLILGYYGFCSSTLIVINKVAVHTLQAPVFILVLQLLFSAVVVKGLNFTGVLEAEGLQWSLVKPFLLIVLGFLGTLYGESCKQLLGKPRGLRAAAEARTDAAAAAAMTWQHPVVWYCLAALCMNELKLSYAAATAAAGLQCSTTRWGCPAAGTSCKTWAAHFQPQVPASSCQQFIVSLRFLQAIPTARGADKQPRTAHRPPCWTTSYKELQEDKLASLHPPC